MIRRAFAIGASTALIASVLVGGTVAAQDLPHPVHIHAGLCPTPR
jgi:hypothetical protein